MKKGERGQHLLDTGEWIPGPIDEETREEVEKETDDQIMERIKCEEEFLEEDCGEYQYEDWRDPEDHAIVASIVYRSYYANILKKREALKKAMDIIVKGKPVDLSENPTIETKGPDVDDTWKEVDRRKTRALKRKKGTG